MDVKQYYRKIAETEAGIADKFPVIVSLETADGGKAGLLSEVPRAVAAKMIVEGRAALASRAETQEYFDQQIVLRQVAEKAEFARRVQVAIIADPSARGQDAGKTDNNSRS